MLKRPVWLGRDHISSTRREKAVQKLTRGKKVRQLGNLVSAIYQNQIPQEDLDTEVSQEIARAFAQCTDRILLFESLRHLETRTKLVEDSRYIRGVLALIRDPSHWLRPIEAQCRQTIFLFDKTPVRRI